MADSLEVLELTIKALALKKSGASWKLIAETMQITQKRASELVKKALESTVVLETEELRELSNQRIESLIMSLWTTATNGTVTAVDRIIKMIELQAKLNNLYSPVDFDPLEMLRSGGLVWHSPMTPEQELRASGNTDLIEANGSFTIDQNDSECSAAEPDSEKILLPSKKE